MQKFNEKINILRWKLEKNEVFQIKIHFGMNIETEKYPILYEGSHYPSFLNLTFSISVEGKMVKYAFNDDFL